MANSNQWYFNKLVKRPCHKTPYRYPHRLNLSFQSSCSCVSPNIKVLKDKDLEFANSIREVIETVRKAVPVTFLFLSYMVPVLNAVKAEIVRGGSGKRDYRNR